MRKLDIAIQKIKESREKFQGENYMYCEKCPEDYGMTNAEECDNGNHQYSCKDCWEAKIKEDENGGNHGEMS
ncbi:hypothetical protein GM661_00450 [Iocasia frigidifontis]|uniref:Uncharacterized protein n=1 Tax=Iocasia fonsfrigidae TaxID=2682810 RepID=A0A8A7K496_9FIRM|nr:hypothetical protein [Iocasia fonsfrigidae]QTL96543.1 hypothetical protein GM661_00450 [Iocasia fonsfrigidae]